MKGDVVGPQAIMVQLEDLGVAEGLDIARSFLGDAEVRPCLAGSLGPLPTGEVLRVWKTRAQIAKQTKHRLHGVDSLIERLRSNPASHPIRLVAFETQSKVGLFFLEREDAKLIGFVIAEKRDPVVEQERFREFQRLTKAGM